MIVKTFNNNIHAIQQLDQIHVPNLLFQKRTSHGMVWMLINKRETKLEEKLIGQSHSQ
jgi:hypothetical protein